MATKNDILKELVLSLSASDFTDFCFICGIFGEYDCVIEYTPQTLADTIDFLHSKGCNFSVNFDKTRVGKYISCTGGVKPNFYDIDIIDSIYTNFSLFIDGYFLSLLCDGSPLFEKDKLEWVVRHSKRELTNVEKLLVGLGRQMEVTIKYTLNNVLDPKAECDAIREILGVDILLEENIVENFDISMKKA